MSSNTEVFDVPVDSPPSDATTEDQADQNSPSVAATATAPVAPLYRDPADVLMTFRLSMVCLVLVLTVLGLSAALIYKVTTAPPLIVIDRTREGDGVVHMDSQQIVDGVALTRDRRPGDEDKRTAANIFSTRLYRVDPQTRKDDLEKAIKMMVPAPALELMKLLRPDLEQQRREHWQTSWEPQVASIDPADAYTVRVVGRQHITRIVKNEVKQETRQLTFTLKLVFDSRGRVDDNERTGFLIADLRDFRIIDEPAPSPSTAPSQP